MIAIALALVCSVGTPSTQDHRPPRRPNVLLILADDLGWRDVSMHGSRFLRTPAIDGLARRGMSFRNAYAASPLCSPTRAAILTGHHPARLRITVPNGHVREELLNPVVPERAAPDRRAVGPQSRNRLLLEEVTIAEVLGGVGYQTAFFGKWHLGWEPYLPGAQGFEHVVGGLGHPGPPSYFSPYHIAS